MAALQLNVQTATAIALTAATAETVLQVIAPTNQRVKILGFGVYFDGATPTAVPVIVQLRRQTTAIGGTPTAVTIYKSDDMIGTTIQTTATTYGTSPTEPTNTDVLKRIEVHPQTGYEFSYPYGQEAIIGSGERVGIICNAPAGVNVIPYIRIEE